MAKIIFNFAGTDDTAKNKSSIDELYLFNEDVIRVYFNGCQDKVVGGSYLFGRLSPNLDVIGAHVRNCFDEKGQLSITALKEKFGKSIIIYPMDTEGAISVDNISLIGFSRGAVTTYSVARHLDNLGKPIQIFAQDPVPGESSKAAMTKGSEFSKNYDLSTCQNIKRAEVVIGGYSGQVNMVHDTFFKQMAPIFNSECESHIYTLPKEHHLSSRGSAENQGIRFIKNTGYSTGLPKYSEEKDSLFFCPKVIAQKHHAHEAMTLELLPIYRKKLCTQLQDSYNQPEQYNDQTLQALFALEKFKTTSSEKNTLRHSILSDQTVNGNAIRDFVIEFENVIQHALRKSPEEKKGSFAMNQFRQSIYKQLVGCSVSIKQGDKEDFIKIMRDGVKGLKSLLTNKEYKELEQVSKLLVSNHQLLTTDFSSSLNASETTGNTREASHFDTANRAAILAKQRVFKNNLYNLYHEEDTSEESEGEDDTYKPSSAV